MIRLYVSLFSERNPARYEEIVACLNANIGNRSIDEIHVLLEGIDAAFVSHEKIVPHHYASRPTYADYLKVAHERASNNDMSIIANSDIYFDENVAVLGQALESHQCAALSRWDITPSGEAVLFDRNDSQDAWVFRGPLKKIEGDFPVGVPRCDNRFLYELRKAGYEVINPAFSVKAYHVHVGPRVEYPAENLEHFVAPPYAYLWPHNLWSLPRTLWYNLRHPDARLAWRSDRRKFNNLLPVRVINRIFKIRGV